MFIESVYLNGLLDVGSQARKFARARLITEHQFTLSSLVSALSRCFKMVIPCLRSCNIKTSKEFVRYLVHFAPEKKRDIYYDIVILTTCIFKASLSSCWTRLCDSSMNVFNLEHTSLGASDTGKSVKQSWSDICSEEATLPSSSGYFQKWRVLSKRNNDRYISTYLGKKWSKKSGASVFILSAIILVLVYADKSYFICLLYTSDAADE